MEVVEGILGFDPSLTSSGFAYLVDGDYHTGRITPKKLKGSERLYFIQQSFHDLILNIEKATGSLDLIVYEGYAMGMPNGQGRLFDIGELGGVLKLVAWGMGIDVLLVPPSNLKQFTTGKGNAKKDQVMASVASNWGYNITQNDEADAFALLKMGEAYLAHRKPRQAHTAKALQSCTIIKGSSSK